MYHGTYNESHYICFAMYVYDIMDNQLLPLDGHGHGSSLSQAVGFAHCGALGRGDAAEAAGLTAHGETLRRAMVKTYDSHGMFETKYRVLGSTFSWT